MTWATRALLSVGMILGFSGSVRAQEKPKTPCPETRTDAPARVELADEELAFERDMERYARYREFTRRLVVEREARAFDEEQARYERFRELTLRLANEAERATERDFERAIELYLAKVALTKSLAARDVSAPSW